METVRIIVPADSPLLNQENSKQLHTYSNGEILLEIPKNIDFQSTPLATGVQLEATAEVESRKNLSDWKNRRAESSMIAYICLIGPSDKEWLEELDKIGLELMRYQPNYSFLCKGNVANFLEALNKKFVERILPIDKGFKSTIELPETGQEKAWALVHVDQAEISGLLHKINSIDGVSCETDQVINVEDVHTRILISIGADSQEELLTLAEVIGIENYEEVVLEDEIADLIIAGKYDKSGKPEGSYLDWLANKDLSGKGTAIGIVDNGVDSKHPAFKGRILDLDGGRRKWHGTFVAGHAAGNYQVEKDKNGFIYGVGVAPEAEIISQSNSGVTRNPSKVCRETVSSTTPSGNYAVIQNNSWGAGTRNPMNYGFLEAEYDRLVRNANSDDLVGLPLTICFSAGNSGRNGLTRPKAAKNVIVTGNSENYRPSVGKGESDNIAEIYSGPHGSSHGNCGDGRIRPHIVAPGEWTASANFGSRPGQKEYISSKLTWGGGTSGASPKTAGVCALLVEWWRKNNNQFEPSPAMLRALIVNGAEPMKSLTAKPPIPSKVQGWGRLHLGNILDDSIHRTYLDQTQIFTERGDTWSQKMYISDPEKPVKLTLAWTDPPGNVGTGTSISNPAIVNKLHVKIITNDKVYHANNFMNGWSIPGSLIQPQLKGLDNLQNIFIPEGVIDGPFEVIVEALDITSNCLTFRPLYPQQDFALVLSNGYPDENFTPLDTFILIDDDYDDVGDDLGDDDYSDDWDIFDDWDWWDDFFFEVQKDESTFNSEIEWWKEKEEVISESSHHTSTLEEKQEDIQAICNLAVLDGVQSKLNKVSTFEIEKSKLDLEKHKYSKLEQKLLSILESWNEQDQDSNESHRKKQLVLKISSNSKISSKEISLLKKIAFQGMLYIISDQANLMANLATRLRNNQNVKYRLADRPEDLPGLLHSTIAEASGAKGLVLESIENNSKAAAYAFDLIESDKRISFCFRQYEKDSLKIRFKISTGEILTQKKLEKLCFIDRQQIGNWYQIILAPKPNHNWVGKWEVMLDCEQESALPIEIISNVWSDFKLSLNFRELQTLRGTDREMSSILWIHAKEPFELKSAALNSRLISSSKKGLAFDHNEEHTQLTEKNSQIEQFTYSNGLSLVIKKKSSEIQDIEVFVSGEDGFGNSFKRVWKVNYFNLPTRLELKKETVSNNLIIKAKIDMVEYEAGVLKRIMLKSDYGRKWVKIRDKKLAIYLSGLDLESSNLSFGVKEDYLISIVEILPDSIN